MLEPCNGAEINQFQRTADRPNSEWVGLPQALGSPKPMCRRIGSIILDEQLLL